MSALQNAKEWIGGFADDLFGTIARNSFMFPTDMDFIPNGTGGNKNIIRLKGGKAQWWGLHSRLQQKRAYEFCFPVSTVVDRLAEYDLTGRLRFIRAKGKGKDKEIDSAWSRGLNKLFSQPNALQSWEQFRGQQVMYKKVFGFCPVYPLLRDGFPKSDAYAMINIPPWCIEPIGKKRLVTADINEQIEGWKIRVLGQEFNLKPDQIIILQDGFHQDEQYDYLLPQSKLVGLDMAVSNICAAMEADNVLLRKKGPLGVISHDAAATKDSQVGYMPMKKSEKNVLQAELANYGLSLAQFQYIISRTAIKFVPFSYNIAELQTKQTVIDCTKHICHRYGYPYILFEESEATYANGDNAIATVFQTNVIPNAQKDINKYNKFFEAEANNGLIDLDYSEVAALQEDRKMSADANLAIDQAKQIEYTSNLITKNEWRVAIGLEEVADGNVYFKDDKPKEITNPKEEENGNA